MHYGVIHSSWVCHRWNTRYCHLYCWTSIQRASNTIWGRHCSKHITMKCVHVMIGCQINLAKYLLVMSSVCLCVCVGGGQGRAQGRALYLYQQPQLLGTKALLLKDHVTVCVCAFMFHPCHVILCSGLGLRSAESLSERFLPLREQADSEHAGRESRWMVGWMDGYKSDRWGVWETESYMASSYLEEETQPHVWILLIFSLWILKQQTCKDASLCYESRQLFYDKASLYFLLLSYDMICSVSGKP